MSKKSDQTTQSRRATSAPILTGRLFDDRGTEAGSVARIPAPEIETHQHGRGDLARALVTRLEGFLGQSAQDRLIRDKPFADGLLMAAGAFILAGAPEESRTPDP